MNPLSAKTPQTNGYQEHFAIESPATKASALAFQDPHASLKRSDSIKSNLSAFTSYRVFKENAQLSKGSCPIHGKAALSAAGGCAPSIEERKTAAMAQFLSLKTTLLEAISDLKLKEEQYDKEPDELNLHKLYVATELHNSFYEKTFNCFSNAYDLGCFPDWHDPSSEEPIALLPADSPALVSYNLNDVD